MSVNIDITIDCSDTDGDGVCDENENRAVERGINFERHRMGNCKSDLLQRGKNTRTQ